jgi:dTMP kinase
LSSNTIKPLGKSKNKGVFITIEGVEGGGKTTNIPFIQQTLIALLPRHRPITLTREPGGTKVGEAIRSVLLSADLPSMHEDTELLLMFAARAEHVRTVITPALEQGHWVICDRFTDASYAYQGGGRGVELKRIAQLEQFTQGSLRPDVTLLFDLDAETGLGRAKQRAELDRFEQENIAFFNRIRSQYLAMAEAEPTRYRTIQADQPLEKVQQQVHQILQAIIQDQQII